MVRAAPEVFPRSVNRAVGGRHHVEQILVVRKDGLPASAGVFAAIDPAFVAEPAPIATLSASFTFLPILITRCWSAEVSIPRPFVQTISRESNTPNYSRIATGRLATQLCEHEADFKLMQGSRKLNKPLFPASASRRIFSRPVARPCLTLANP